MTLFLFCLFSFCLLARLDIVNKSYFIYKYKLYIPNCWVKLSFHFEAGLAALQTLEADNMWANPWGGTWPIQQSAYQNMPHEQGKNTHSVFSSFLLAVLYILLCMPISEVTKTLSSSLLALWSLAYEEEEKKQIAFCTF